MRRTVASAALSLITIALAGVSVGAQQADISTGEVDVLDPGAEPRQLLRYRFVEGSTEVLESVIDNAISISVNGVESEAFDLSMALTTTTTVTEVFDDGSARVDYVITDWELGDMGGMATDPAELDGALALMEGFGGWWVLDTRGAVLDFGLDLPTDVPLELTAQLDQAVIEVEALPEEPVGVGAVWEVRTSTGTAGMELAMVQISEILSIDDDVIGLQQQFVSGTDADAGGLALMQIDLSGGGTAELRLDRVSQPATMETAVTTTMSFGDGDDVTEIVTDAVTNVVATLVE